MINVVNVGIEFRCVVQVILGKEGVFMELFFYCLLLFIDELFLHLFDEILRAVMNSVKIQIFQPL